MLLKVKKQARKECALIFISSFRKQLRSTILLLINDLLKYINGNCWFSFLGLVSIHLHIAEMDADSIEKKRASSCQKDTSNVYA